MKSVLQPKKADAASEGRPTQDAVDAEAGSAGQRHADTARLRRRRSRAPSTPAARAAVAGRHDDQGRAITIDSKSGDLAATGPVTTTTMLEQDDKNGEQGDACASIGTAEGLQYEDAIRRATYTGDAHMNGPQGDMTAPTIELFLKPSGDELERAEAYDERRRCASRAARPRARA